MPSFPVTVGGNFLPGLQMLSGAISDYRKKEEEEKEQDRIAKLKQDMVEVYRTGDPDKMAEFSMLHPEVSELLSKQANFRSERTKDSYFRSAYSVIADPSEENVNKMAASRQAYLKAMGQSEEDMPYSSTFMDKYNTDPEKAVNDLKIEVAGLDPKRWKAFQEALYGKPSEQATPTDIDDFVADAEAESMRVTGEPLTPGDRNKARLEFKRAQSREVAANRWASRSVDANTAEKIKYNEKMGTQLAEITTAGDLMKAKGEISPEAKKATARGRMEGNLAKLANHYVTLDSTGAMLNVDNSTLDNIMAASRSSAVGQMFGRITGSNEQSIRSSIKKLKPLIVQDIRRATDMGARGLDSEKELEFYLQAATDEKTDIQSNIAAIVVLDEAYGTGKVAEKLRSLTNQSLIKRISDEGALILNGGGKAESEVVNTLPPGSKLIGTSGGKNVYQTPDGSKFIEE
jgi:hypothetical protein